MTICPADLRDHYLAGRLIPFLGAGTSMSVTWTEGSETKRGPSWAELVGVAAQRLGFKDASMLRVRGTDLQILEYFGIRNSDEFASLTNWLFAEMRPPDGALMA